jgi:tripeptide aminopeptidase
MDITERFINYTKFDTQSSEDSDTVPSTAKQLIFAKYLKEELEKRVLTMLRWMRWAISMPL